ncbi:hypothetical protein LSH36_136g05020 [Paralvinella palmiformis]|uniref:Uncharacterized protein n=1 Tax=Paralvinella palmiformis TaxID=53620 RepID=A0AAD9N835_9ANNE|nr:hypothetical protein LSH36_136g05020 [Paralvinella palmiformis]
MDTYRLRMTVVWIVLATLVGCEANPDAKRLYDDIIMKHYDKNVRPTTNTSMSTIIRFGIRLAQIVDIDEVNQIMTLNLWADQRWTDPRFSWDVKAYNNISMLFVPAEKLWRPDIVLYNNADGEYAITEMGKAVIYPNGNVSYSPPMQFKSSCEINVEYFPFDEQLCHLKFGPWTHDASKVDVVHIARDPNDSPEQLFIKEGVILDGYQQSAEWDLMEATAQENHVPYPCCPNEPYPDVTFYITLRRKHLYYVINLVIPCMSMNILTIVAFYLPSSSGEKIGITISVFLSLSLFQLVLFDLTPSSSLSLPLIGKYIMVTSFLVTLSVMSNAMILNMNHRMSSTHEMSAFIRWLFLGVLSRLLYLRLPTSDRNTSPLDENIMSYRSEYTDLSNYANPYLGHHDIDCGGGGDGCAERIQNQWNTEKVCEACQKRRMAKLPPIVEKGINGICFLAKHYKDEDDSNRVIDEWRYVALIFDRVLLWIYVIVTLIISMETFLNAPALYDDKKPLVIP